MTTFQDPQPQSRRAVRQSERDDSTEAQGPTPLIYPGTTPSGDTWDTLARRAAQLPPAVPRSEPPVAAGRRSAPVAPVQTPEPLQYATESRQASPPEQPPVQQPSVQQNFRPRGTSVPPVEPVPAPAASESTFRRRDFSPEGVRAAVPQAWVDPAAAPAPAPGSSPGDLEYRTEVRFPSGSEQAPYPAQQGAPGIPLEQTMSRRELRAQLAAEQEEQTGARPAPDSSVPNDLAPSPTPSVFPPAPTPEVDTGLTNAMAEFDALAQRSATAQQHAATEQAAQQAAAQQAAAQQAAAQQAATQQSQQAAAQQAAAQQAAWAAEQQAQQAATHKASEQRAADQYAAEQQAQQLAAQHAAWAAQQQAAQQQAAVVQPERTPEPSVWTPPPGHWSAQPGIDEQDPFENTYSRSFGSAPATTSALVISSVPADIRGPLTGTGEIIVTGTVDLPRSFSSTGASARFDSEGIDAFFDADDAEVISTDSAPVRAIKAVSTHNSGQGVMHTQKPKGTRALTVLLIAASVMAVAVAGLLVAAFAFNIF